MGGINGVVYNQSDCEVSYILCINEIKLHKKRVENDINLKARLSANFEEINTKIRNSTNSKVKGSLDAQLLYRCVEEFELQKSSELVYVKPKSIVFQGLQDIQPKSKYISLFVHIGQEKITLIENVLIKVTKDVCLKIREDLSFKNMDSKQTDEVIRKNQAITNPNQY